MQADASTHRESSSIDGVFCIHAFAGKALCILAEPRINGNTYRLVSSSVGWLCLLSLNQFVRENAKSS